MAPFIDPEMNHLIKQYYDSGCDPMFLYGGSQENIVKELQAWVVRRKEVSQLQQELQEKLIDVALELKSGPETEQDDAALAEGVRNVDRAQVVDDEENEDTARAAYLLHTLKHRDILWPKLWWRPDHDGGVCSFLGTVDPTFDPDITLGALQDVERRERLRAKMEDFKALVDAEVIKLVDEEGNPIHVSHAGSQSNAGKTSPTEMKKKTSIKPLTPASVANPAKWSKIVEAVNSGNYPDFRIDEEGLVAVNAHQKESRLRLKTLMKDVSRDMHGDWMQRQLGDGGSGH